MKKEEEELNAKTRRREDAKGKKKKTISSLFASLCLCAFALNLFSFFPLTAESFSIDSRGAWHGTAAVSHHTTDYALAYALADFFGKEEAQSVVDFGCGVGNYVKVLRMHEIACEGYDGNPETPQISGGIASVIDLSVPFDLGKRFDWVLSLEVGEHLPKEFERIFLENLHRHNVKGIVLSWAAKGQGGEGHVNEQNNGYIKELMMQYGYVNDSAAENQLRNEAVLWWFKNTVMIFRRK